MYGRVWILLPALIALRTCHGALAGARAVPSGWSAAVPLEVVVVVVVVVVVLPGGPDPPVWAMAGTAPASDATSSSPASHSLRLLLRVSDRKPLSFVGLRG
jgi:hypothetical protein